MPSKTGETGHKPSRSFPTKPPHPAGAGEPLSKIGSAKPFIASGSSRRPNRATSFGDNTTVHKTRSPRSSSGARYRT